MEESHHAGNNLPLASLCVIAICQSKAFFGTSATPSRHLRPTTFQRELTSISIRQFRQR